MGPRPHLFFFPFKTATLAPELQVSMCAALIFSFSMQNIDFGSELQVSMGPRLRLMICESQIACLDPE